MYRYRRTFNSLIPWNTLIKDVQNSLPDLFLYGITVRIMGHPVGHSLQTFVATGRLDSPAGLLLGIFFQSLLYIIIGSVKFPINPRVRLLVGRYV